MKMPHQQISCFDLLRTLITHLSSPNTLKSFAAVISTHNDPFDSQSHLQWDQNLQKQQAFLQPTQQTNQQIFEHLNPLKKEAIQKNIEEQTFELQFPQALSDKKVPTSQQQLTAFHQSPKNIHQISTSDKAQVFCPAVPQQSLNIYQKLQSHNQTGDKKNGRNYSAQSKNSVESSVNFQLTLKTKQGRNTSNMRGKGDSLIYSDATFLNSNQTAFGLDIPHQGLQSHRSALKHMESGNQQQNQIKIERAVSREIERVNRDSRQYEKKENRKRSQEEVHKIETEESIFTTQVNVGQGKFAKMRQLKQQKKKKLEAELKKINQQIDYLAHRQFPHQPFSKNNNYQSRVKISDNVEARLKAERLVKNLKEEKRSRHQAHLGGLEAVDKNIHYYMEELMKERYKNEERTKQRKKLQIIERMKQQEVRKMEDQKHKDKNIEFVKQLKNSSSKPNVNLKQNYECLPKVNSPLQQNNEGITQRSPQSNSKNQKTQATPELSRKKADFKKIRNLSYRKQEVNIYQQILK